MKKQDIINTYKRMVKEYNELSKTCGIYLMLLDNDDFRHNFAEEIKSITEFTDFMYYEMQGYSFCMNQMKELLNNEFMTKYRTVTLSEYSTSYSIYPTIYTGKLEYEEKYLVSKDGKEIK